MCPPNKKKSDFKILDFIINESFEALENTEDDLKVVFHEEGLDYEIIKRHGKEFISNLKREYIFKKAEEKKIIVQEILNNFKKKTIEKIRQDLTASLIGPDAPELAPTFFHKLEKLYDQDLEDIALEQEILEIIETEFELKDE